MRPLFAETLYYLLVEVLNTAKGLQSVAKYLLSGGGLSIISKCRGAELNHTGYSVSHNKIVRIKVTTYF